VRRILAADGGSKGGGDGEDIPVTWSGQHARRGGRTVLGRPPALVLVVAEKLFSALGAAGTAVLVVALDRRGGIDAALLRLSQELSEDPNDVALRWLAGHLPHVGLGPGVALWTGAGLTFWALLLGAEAVGLWLERGWGEFLIVVETASFLPVELWDILARGHGFAVVGLVVNLLILAYVGGLYRRRARRRPAPSGAAREPGDGGGRPEGDAGA
jgi:uncharacterized membrane protein (DUF2068 family)